MREVLGFRLISGWGVFLKAHDFCRFLVEFPVNLRRLQFFYFVIFFYLFFLFLFLFVWFFFAFLTGSFSLERWVGGLYFARSILKLLITVLFFAVFEVALSH